MAKAAPERARGSVGLRSHPGDLLELMSAPMRLLLPPSRLGRLVARTRRQ